MKKAAAVLALAFALLSACSDSGPQVTNASSTDMAPVAGQRVKLDLYAVTDDFRGTYPMLYDWSCNGGLLEYVENTSPIAYWTAPDSAGSYSVTCNIKDNSNSNKFTWNLAVTPRTLAEITISGTAFSGLLAKDANTAIGGIYAATNTNKVWYYSANSAYQTSLSLAADQTLVAMTAWKMSAYGYSYDTIYAASKSTTATPTTYSITALYGGKNYAITPPNTAYEINAVEVSGDYLLIGTAGHGLAAMYLSGGAATDESSSFSGIPSGATINSFAIKDNYLYAATEDGIYMMDCKASLHAFTLVKDNAGGAVTTDDVKAKSIALRKKTDTQYELWTVTSNTTPNRVWRYTVNLTSSRAISNVTATDVADATGTSLAVDLKNQVWNGRRYFSDTDSSFHDIADGSSADFSAIASSSSSIVSPEGLLYLIDSGRLWVWGKKYSG